MIIKQDIRPRVSTFIRVRTEFEGYHHYPCAGDIDPRIAFLENKHRHVFKVEIKISVNHSDRELEFFLVKWALQDFIKSGDQDNKSCEMIARDILEKHLRPKYGERYYEVVVSEDGESDGVVNYYP
jgi:predicted GNAT family acetyltransferase